MVAGLANRVPDVLLVHPPLGQVYGGVVLPGLLTGPVQQPGHDAGAQHMRGLDPALVLRIQRCVPLGAR